MRREASNGTASQTCLANVACHHRGRSADLTSDRPAGCRGQVTHRVLEEQPAGGGARACGRVSKPVEDRNHFLMRQQHQGEGAHAGTAVLVGVDIQGGQRVCDVHVANHQCENSKWIRLYSCIHTYKTVQRYGALSVSARTGDSHRGGSPQRSWLLRPRGR